MKVNRTEGIDEMLNKLSEKDLLILLLKNIVKIETKIHSMDYALKEIYGDFYTNLLKVPEEDQGVYDKQDDLLPSTILLNNIYENHSEFWAREADLEVLGPTIEAIRDKKEPLFDQIVE